MKIKSLLLGSAAAVAMSSAAVAGGAPALGDICDELGITGITISSSDTCLQISGSFDYEVEFENSTATNDELDFATDVAEATVGFLATQASDYGPAQVFLKLKAGGDDLNTPNPFNGTGEFSNNVFLDEAWVSAGGFTAGLKGDLDDDGGDDVFNYQGLRVQGDTDGLADALAAADDTGDHFLVQFTTELSDGIGFTISLEDLDDTDIGADVGGPDIAGQLTFDQAAFSGHIFAEISDVHNTNSEINVKGIVNFNIDDYGKVRIAGGWEDNAGFVNGAQNSHLLASFETMIDVVTLAISGEVAELTGTDFWSVGASAAFGVADGVTLTVGGYYGDNETADEDWEAAIKADIDLADDLVLTLEAHAQEIDTVESQDISAELVWKPTATQTWNVKVAVDDDSVFSGEIGAAGSF